MSLQGVVPLFFYPYFMPEIRFKKIESCDRGGEAVGSWLISWLVDWWFVGIRDWKGFSLNDFQKGSVGLEGFLTDCPA